MIVDTSAVVAVLQGEPEEHSFRTAINDAHKPLISAASYVELSIVVERKKAPRLLQHFDKVLELLELEITPVSAEQARTARRAFRDYGKGMGHPAQLNFGDCFSYALAKETGMPLLFTGNDFSVTDVVPAL